MVIFDLKNKKGFTLIEILVVVSIIGLLASIILVSVGSAREKGKVANAGNTAKNLTLALELYYSDMGFYPPDVSRGWDPGFQQPLPYNPDTGQSDTPVCSYCPSNWADIVQEKWNGPYIQIWPQLTPWKGKYDYNYWSIETVRYGCSIMPGIYIGIQGDYNNENIIPSYAEQAMIDQDYDADNCINGESQILLYPL
jgi:general secretion pathway protein G